eukprot:gnl/MRDRNA2_/MRDRNA2_106060_c0_seq1.p1 gnl/MRDRNA2_/MRDRNA2_106060_c0~~gnl/MRDRNA2_/MRDRNA2_106060_c0_seq1.p1  ORF type:complete len:1622 (-),score=222.61 gnl/MRDRNA2_/MRDRNA2_106060_c0_seq1:119-4771(-)
MTQTEWLNGSNGSVNVSAMEGLLEGPRGPDGDLISGLSAGEVVAHVLFFSDSGCEEDFSLEREVAKELETFWVGNVGASIECQYRSQIGAVPAGSPAHLQIPMGSSSAGATHLVVLLANELSAQRPAAVPLADVVVQITGVTFRDIDVDGGVIEGDIMWDPLHVNKLHHLMYVTAALFCPDHPLKIIGDAYGKTALVNVPKGTTTNGCTEVHVYPVNVKGRQHPMSIPLDDYDARVRNASFTDFDLRLGQIQGTITWEPPEDLSLVLHYAVFLATDKRGANRQQVNCQMMQSKDCRGFDIDCPPGEDPVELLPVNESNVTNTSNFCDEMCSEIGSDSTCLERCDAAVESGIQNDTICEFVCIDNDTIVGYQDASWADNITANMSSDNFTHQLTQEIGINASNRSANFTHLAITHVSHSSNSSGISSSSDITSRNASGSTSLNGSSNASDTMSRRLQENMTSTAHVNLSVNASTSVTTTSSSSVGNESGHGLPVSNLTSAVLGPMNMSNASVGSSLRSVVLGPVINMSNSSNFSGEAEPLLTMNRSHCMQICRAVVNASIGSQVFSPPAGMGLSNMSNVTNQTAAPRSPDAANTLPAHSRNGTHNSTPMNSTYLASSNASGNGTTTTTSPLSHLANTTNFSEALNLSQALSLPSIHETQTCYLPVGDGRGSLTIPLHTLLGEFKYIAIYVVGILGMQTVPLSIPVVDQIGQATDISFVDLDLRKDSVGGYVRWTEPPNTAAEHYSVYAGKNEIGYHRHKITTVVAGIGHVLIAAGMAQGAWTHFLLYALNKENGPQVPMVVPMQNVEAEVSGLHFEDVDLDAGEMGGILTWVPPTLPDLANHATHYSVYLASGAQGFNRSFVANISINPDTSLNMSLDIDYDTKINGKAHIVVYTSSLLGEFNPKAFPIVDRDASVLNVHFDDVDLHGDELGGHVVFTPPKDTSLIDGFKLYLSEDRHGNGKLLYLGGINVHAEPNITVRANTPTLSYQYILAYAHAGNWTQKVPVALRLHDVDRRPPEMSILVTDPVEVAITSTIRLSDGSLPSTAACVALAPGAEAPKSSQMLTLAATGMGKHSFGVDEIMITRDVAIANVTFWGLDPLKSYDVFCYAQDRLGHGVVDATVADTRKTVSTPLICGSGRRFRDLGEECDDGNLRNDDGCDENCRVEIGWVCDGGDRNGPDQCDIVRAAASSTVTLSFSGELDLDSPTILLDIRAVIAALLGIHPAFVEIQGLSIPGADGGSGGSRRLTEDEEGVGGRRLTSTGVPSGSFSLILSFIIKMPSAAPPVPLSSIMSILSRQGLGAALVASLATTPSFATADLQSATIQAPVMASNEFTGACVCSPGVGCEHDFWASANGCEIHKSESDCVAIWACQWIPAPHFIQNKKDVGRCSGGRYPTGIPTIETEDTKCRCAAGRVFDVVTQQCTGNAQCRCNRDGDGFGCRHQEWCEDDMADEWNGTAWNMLRKWNGTMWIYDDRGGTGCRSLVGGVNGSNESSVTYTVEECGKPCLNGCVHVRDEFSCKKNWACTWVLNADHAYPTRSDSWKHGFYLR